MNLITLYNKLLVHHGQQGWWPVKGAYHKNDYSIPRNKHERFEIIIGAILTQNTAWTNVEKALKNLRFHKLINAKKILLLPIENLSSLIKPAGYFNQKANYLKEIAKEFLENDERWKKLDAEILREELLKIKGIGKETADSIILYAYKKPIFVIDAYTIRLLLNLKMISKEESKNYDLIRKKIQFELSINALSQEISKEEKVIIYNEFHALIVEHCKKHYSKKPYGENDWLLDEK